MTRFTGLLLGLAIVAATIGGAAAMHASLVVKGLASGVGPDGIVLDLAALEALPGRTTVTRNPWSDGAISYSGPLGRSILEAVGSTGTTVRVTALNDYVAHIPVSDFYDYDVIFATRVDGKPISVRSKGPIFIIYPFDEHPELNSERYFVRSVWQVKSIEIQ